MADFLARWAMIGAVCAGLIGCVTGLVIGLRVHPPTAWFATFEVGIPSAIAGAVVGVAGAGLSIAVRRVRWRT